MDSKITINIVEPGGPTPDPVVPNTGLFTHGIGGPEATIITTVSTVLLLTIVAVVVAMLYKKHKKQGKATKLVSTVDACATVVKSKKRVSTGLAAVALLVSAGTFAGLLVNAGKSNTNAAEGEDGLTLDVSSEDFTIEVGDEPVFAVLPVELTVEEATQAGYTLTAYTENTGLVSTTDSSKVIPMVAVDEGELVALADNTYGLALDEEPTTKDAEVYMPLSIDSDTPTILKATDYVETEANDTTTIYYGFYITPDVPYGTYTGTNINYNVEPHYITNLAFDGNGSDGGTAIEGMTLVAGDTITLPQNTYTREGYSFTGWNTEANGEGKAYADEADFTASFTESEDITLYAQWEEDLPIISDLTEMQDFAKLSAEEKASVLASMTSGQQYQLKDNRDQTMYYIAKLADGHVWMTQNLDLDIEVPAEGSIVYDSTNTNLPAGAKWEPERATIAKDDLSSDTWPSDSEADNNPYSYDPGDVYYYTSGNNNPDTATDKATCEQAHQDGSCAHYRVGNYYNWSAAVASNDTSEYGDDDQYANVDTDICPAGWELPNGPQNGTDLFEDNEFNALIVSQDGIVGERPTYCGGLCPFYNYVDGGFNKFRTEPLWLARSGYVFNGSLSSTGYGGYYWSSTVSSSSGAYALDFDSSAVYPAYNSSRYYGYSVRCIAQ